MPVTEKQSKRTMLVNLTAEELSALGSQQAEIRLEANRVKAERTEAVSEFNAKLKTMNAQLDTIAKQVHDHQAEKEIDVIEIYDDDREMVEVRTADEERRLLSEFTRDYTMQEKGARFAKAQGTLFDGTTDPDAKEAADEARAPEATEEDDDGEDDAGESDEDEPVEAAKTDPSELAAPEGDANGTPNANGTRVLLRRSRVPRDLPPEDGAS